MEKAIIEAFIRFISFKGIHAKYFYGNLNPYQDEGQKYIEYLTDGDTVIFALSEAGELFLMEEGHFSFMKALESDLLFSFAFSMPKAFWEEQKRTESEFFRMVATDFAS